MCECGSPHGPNEERSLGAAARGRTHVSSDCSWHAGHSPAGHFGDRAAGQIGDFGSGAGAAPKGTTLHKRGSQVCNDVLVI